MILDLETLSKNAIYHTLTQIVIPRPVAWVLSENKDSSYNLAPFSYFSVVCSDPAIVMISVGRKPDGSEKDTYSNITERKNLVIHIPCSAQAESVTRSAAVLPAGESEVEFCSLQTEKVEGFALPRVVGAPVALACSLHKVESIGRSDQHLIFAEINHVWVDDSYVVQDEKGRMRMDAEGIDPIGRLGGSEYVTFGEVINIPRVS